MNIRAKRQTRRVTTSNGDLFRICKGAEGTIIIVHRHLYDKELSYAMGHPTTQALGVLVATYDAREYTLKELVRRYSYY